MPIVARANLKVAGSHAGVSMGQDGPSQMGLEDLAMFRTLPARAHLERMVMNAQRYVQNHVDLQDKTDEDLVQEEKIFAAVNPQNTILDNTDPKKQFQDYLDAKHLFYCDKEDPNLTLYYWTVKRWSPKVEGLILAEIADYFQSLKPPVCKDAVLDYYKGKGQKTKVVPKPPHIIAFNNGLLNIDTMEFCPPRSDLFTVNIIPVDYDPKATCPHWEQFQKDIHQEKDLQFSQEWRGYQLYTEYPKEGFLVAIGNGNNGKTVEFYVIRQILGEANFTAISLQEITYNDFAMAECYHKLSNNCDDLGVEKIVSTGRLKRLSAGSIVNAQRKFGHPFDFKNYAKPSYACNDPPQIDDDSDGFNERMKLMKYLTHFTDNPDPTKNERHGINREELYRILLDEAPGIINWMLEGLK